MPPCARRWSLVGDPQTTLARLTRFLDEAQLLAPDGRLRDDVGLVSLGDHFDFHGEPAEVAREGLAVLRWLASHPPEQVVILAGNHDLARVMELAHFSDETFAAAQRLARDPLAAQSLRDAFPDAPPPGLVARDYHAFTEAQRALVTELLRAGRMRLAARATHATGAPMLLTHAGVTQRELSLLGLARARDADALADALNAHLARAVAAWSRGDTDRLDLAPLHRAGTPGEEGGGLLYHRPAYPDPQRPDAWSWSSERPRRFDPRALPEGLVQACGHTGHAKCRSELGPWMRDEHRAVTKGGLRTLSARGDAVSYEMDLRDPAPGAATLYLLDGDMARDVSHCAFMSVPEVRVP